MVLRSATPGVLGVVLAGMLATPAAADQPPPIKDPTLRDRLALLHDGKGHYVALVDFARCRKPAGPRVSHLPTADRIELYGDGKVFYKLHTQGRSASCPKGGKRLSVTFWEPRAARPIEASLSLDHGTYTVRCQDRKTALTRVPEQEARKLLSKARFLEPLWRRAPYALARDDRGVYYYVDARSRTRPREDFRLYAGPRGNLKLQRMRNVVSDSEGDIFSTRKGTLRLILGRTQATWIKGRRRTPLQIVPVARNMSFIFRELGPYIGQRLGTPCDDL